MARLDDFTRIDAEDFLFTEASLLDEWRLDEWRALFLRECRYLVPNLNGDPHSLPEEMLYIIADDGHHLTERVKRLGKRTAHAEFPHSRTRRLISNVRIVERAPEQLHVQSSFVTYRSHRGITDTYFGRHEHLLVVLDDDIRIVEKRSILDMGALRPHGHLSIIV